jgi:hypothetical protein
MKHSLVSESLILWLLITFSRLSLFFFFLDRPFFNRNSNNLFFSRPLRED